MQAKLQTLDRPAESETVRPLCPAVLHGSREERHDRLLDDALADSFPASDPPAITVH